MKFKMTEKSLFAILLRSPWSVSFAITIGFALAAKAWLPVQYFVFGALGGLPFAVIGAVAAWRQFSAPNAAHVTDTLAQIGAMQWQEFSINIAQAFQRDGYEVQRLDGVAADFALVKAGRTTLLSCKRWKAAHLGLEIFQALEATRSARAAHCSLCITTGAVTYKARQFAAAQHMTVMQGTELAQLLRPVLMARKQT